MGVWGTLAAGLAVAGVSPVGAGRAGGGRDDLYVLPSRAPSETLRIDGRIEPGEWPDGARGTGFFDRQTGAVSDEQAEFWLVSDREAVYLAFRVATDPARVVADETRANVSLRSNDHVKLSLDLFGAGRTIDEFAVNASGAYSITLAGGRAAKTEWLGELVSAGRRTESGWEAEARIPWSLMKLPPAGQRDIRFNVVWFRTNRGASYEWKPTRLDSSNFAVWRAVEVPSLRPGRDIKALAYSSLGFDSSGRPVLESGVDAKAAVGSGLEAVVTVNPDFRNVEQGILSLDFSNFERLAADARPFFQEGARFRNTGFDQRLFASQRVAKLDAGLNVYGDLGGRTQVGLLGLVETGDRTATSLTVTHALTARDTAVVAYVGNRQEGLDSDGFQLNLNRRIPGGSVYCNTQFTDDEVRRSGSRVSAGVSKEEGGWGRSLEVNQVTPSFFPRLGFSPERDLRGGEFGLSREVQPARGPFLSHEASLEGRYLERFSGKPYRKEIEVEASARMRSGHFASLDLEWSRFEGSVERESRLSVGWPHSNPYRQWSIRYTNGLFRGSAYDALAAQFATRPLPRLQLTASAEFVRFRGFDRQTVATFNWEVGRLESFGGRIVNRGDDWNWYASYRLGGGRGIEAVVVLGDPNARSFARQVLVKLVVPVSIRIEPWPVGRIRRAWRESSQEVADRPRLLEAFGVRSRLRSPSSASARCSCSTPLSARFDDRSR